MLGWSGTVLAASAALQGVEGVEEESRDLLEQEIGTAVEDPTNHSQSINKRQHLQQRDDTSLSLPGPTSEVQIAGF